MISRSRGKEGPASLSSFPGFLHQFLDEDKRVAGFLDCRVAPVNASSATDARESRLSLRRQATDAGSRLHPGDCRLRGTDADAEDGVAMTAAVVVVTHSHSRSHAHVRRWREALIPSSCAHTASRD